MQNDILALQPQWRYCRVRAGEKRPYPANWQNTPLRLQEVDSANIGLILGPSSQGVVACDFDGVTAIDWFRQQFPQVELPVTPAWTSGRAGRVQMAFQVDELLWPVLQTKKIKTGEGEGFEFRWTGAQSVLPPSVHPVTGLPYQWITTAAESVKSLPYPVLEYWAGLCNQDGQPEDQEPERTVWDLQEQDVQEAERLLKKLREQQPTLDYDTWRTVSWALAHGLGRDAARVLINLYYPEQRRGEYDQLFRTWNKSRSPTIATLKHMVGESRQQRQEQRRCEYQAYQQEQLEIQQLRLEILRRKS